MQGNDSSSEATSRINLGPSGAELFSVFRLPVVGLVIALGMLGLGISISSDSVNLATILAGVFVLLSLGLAIMEWRDLAFAALTWDDDGLTLELRGAASLTLKWSQIAEVRIREVAIPRRIGPKRHRLWVEVRPIDWKTFARTSGDREAYTPSDVSDYTVGIPASQGAQRKKSLDRALREADIRCYSGVSSSISTASGTGRRLVR